MVPAGEPFCFATQERADIFISNFVRAADEMLDVAVTSPLCSSNVDKAASSTLHAANSMHVVKETKYSKSKVHCTPIVVETLGAWTAQSLEFFKKLASAVASRTGLTRGKQLYSIMLSLSVLLQKENGRMLALRYFGEPSP